MPSAFPLDGFDVGMTLRDYFANSAMQGIVSNEKRYKNAFDKTNTGEIIADTVAKDAYRFADAMLKQREL